MRTVKAALALGVGAVLGSWWMLVGTASASTPPPAPPSAIGADAVHSIVVSPAYTRTGLVVVSSTPGMGCPDPSKPCPRLWASHDRGVTWSRLAATGWDGGTPFITLDASGKEILYSTTETSLLRSSDGGQTWTQVSSSGGLPAAMPQPDTLVMAAKGQDYMVQNGRVTQQVQGSGQSTLRDTGFMLAPAFPSGGSFAPALLAAADPKSGLPVLQQCTTDLVCQGATTLPGATVYSVPVRLFPSTTYGSDGTVFAYTGRGLYKSQNGGESYTPLALGDPTATATAVSGFALSPGYAEAGATRSVYASVIEVFNNTQHPDESRTAGGVYHSTNGGSSWTLISSGTPLDYGAVALALAPDGHVFAGYAGQGHSGLLCSPDGRSWQATCGTPGGKQPSGGSRQSGVAGQCTGGACAAATQTASQSSQATGSASGNDVQAPSADTIGSHAPKASGGGRLALGIGAGVVAVLLIGAALLRSRLQGRGTS